MYGNGQVHHHHSEAVVNKLCAAGLLQDGGRGNPEVIDAALNALLDKVMAVPAGHPVPNIFISPQIECAANTHMMHALLELLVVLDMTPAKAVEALIVKAQGSGNAAHMPAGLSQLLLHYADVMAWQLKPHGVSIDAKGIARRGQR
jgi:hypothetical protein